MLFSCFRNGAQVVLWTCDDAVLYLNTMDTCIMVQDSLSAYDMYISIRHHDRFTMNGIRFAVEVRSASNTICDTILMPLSDSLGCWNGTPHIGAYVKKVPTGISLPSSDSAKFSITPIMSEAREGVDWLAIELEKHE